MNRNRAAIRNAGAPLAGDQVRVLALLVSLACALVVVPVGAQTRSAVRASAQVLAASAAPDPATVSAWVREWRLSEAGAPGGGVAPQPRRVAGQERIDSEFWTATLAERCDPLHQRRCGVLVTVVFTGN